MAGEAMMRVVAVVGVAGLAMVEGGIISSSTLQMCEKREDGENVDTDCEEKMVRCTHTARGGTHRNQHLPCSAPRKEEGQVAGGGAKLAIACS